MLGENGEFGITEVTPINTEMEGVIDDRFNEEINNRSNGYSEGNSVIENESVGNIKSNKDRQASGRLPELVENTENRESERGSLPRQSRRNSKLNENSEESSFSIPKNVKEIKNMSEFLRKAYEQETNKEWKDRLYDAKTANYTRLDNRRSPLKYKREIVQQYLDYKNGVNDSSDVQYSIDTETGNNTDNIDSTDLSSEHCYFHYIISKYSREL